MTLRETFKSIADAIRAKLGSTDALSPAAMAAGISSIPSAKPEETKTVTASVDAFDVTPSPGHVLSKVTVSPPASPLPDFGIPNPSTSTSVTTLGVEREQALEAPYYGLDIRHVGMTSKSSGPAFFVIPRDGMVRAGAYRIATRAYKSTSTTFGRMGYVYVPGTSDKSVGNPDPDEDGEESVWLANGFTIKGDANLVPANIVTGKTVFGVVGSAPVPSGNVDITTTAQVNVANYATATVVDPNLVPANIVAGKTILGVAGSASAGGGTSLVGHTLTLNAGGSMSIGDVTVLKPDGTVTSVSVRTYAKITDVVAWRGPTFFVWTDDGQRSMTYGSLLSGDTTVYIPTGCLLRGTMISLADGSRKPIEDVTYDDELLVWDFDSGRMSSAYPFWIKRAECTDHYWVNTFASGRVVRTTGTVAGHRFFDMDAGAFVYNTDCVGHRVYTLDGPDVLVSADHVAEPCEFYNLNTYRHINCFADGVLASCRLNNLYPFAGMRFVKDPGGLVRHDAASFDGVPTRWVEGGRFVEQPMAVDDLVSYAFEREVVACS